MGRIRVGVNVAGLPACVAAYRDFKDKYINQLVRNGARRAGSRTARLVKVDTQRHDRTGQLSKSRGMKYKAYRQANIWIVLVGARAGYRAFHPFWGVIDPTRYDHIVEGGRKMVVAGTRTSRKGSRLIKNSTGKSVLAIKVKTLRIGAPTNNKYNAPAMIHLQLLIPPKGKPGGRQSRGRPGNLSMRIRRILKRTYGIDFHVRQGKKVAGGYIVFAKFARAVRGVKPVENNKGNFIRYSMIEVTQEIQTGIPKILAKYGSKVYK